MMMNTMVYMVNQHQHDQESIHTDHHQQKHQLKHQEQKNREQKLHQFKQFEIIVK